jgi:hypothetical protein
MASIRKFTDEQFSEGTTIDGNRLEQALQDLERWSEKIPDGDMANRWMQTQIVMKYLPPTVRSDATLATNTGFATNFQRAPFLPIYNKEDSTNPMRLKGTKLPWNTPYRFPSAGSFQDQYAWTSTMQTGKSPVILDAINLAFITDVTEYINDLINDPAGGGPAGELAGSSLRDVQIQVTADNPFLKEDQRLNSILFHRFLFKLENSKLSPVDPGVAFTDMLPNLSSVGTMVTQHQKSVMMWDENLAIPVPPFTRLRFSLILPAGYPPWNGTPWRTGVPTMTLTLLEGLTQ